MRLQSETPIYLKWYMDDGGIVADIDLLRKVWELLKSYGALILACI